MWLTGNRDSMSKRKLHAHHIAELQAVVEELRVVFTEAGQPPVFPRLHDERYAEGVLAREMLLARVRRAVNQCAHAPQYGSNATIKLKMLTPLAKDGRGENPDAFAQFDATQYAGMPPPAAAEPQGPRIETFRAPGKSEADTQAEYAHAKDKYWSAARSSARAEKRKVALDADALESQRTYEFLQKRIERAQSMAAKPSESHCFPDVLDQDAEDERRLVPPGMRRNVEEGSASVLQQRERENWLASRQGAVHPHPLRLASPWDVYPTAAQVWHTFTCDVCKKQQNDNLVYHCDEYAPLPPSKWAPKLLPPMTHASDPGRCGIFDACVECAWPGQPAKVQAARAEAAKQEQARFEKWRADKSSGGCCRSACWLCTAPQDLLQLQISCSQPGQPFRTYASANQTVQQVITSLQMRMELRGGVCKELRYGGATLEPSRTLRGVVVDGASLYLQLTVDGVDQRP